MNLYFSVSFHQPFPLVSKWAVMVIQALPKTFHCEIRIQLICGGLCLPLPNMGPNKKVLLHILILTDHKPVTDGFNTTINGNFKKCLWILSPADDGAFTIRNGSAKSAQMHIFITVQMSFVFSFFFHINLQSLTADPAPQILWRFSSSTSLLPWSLHRGNSMYFTQGRKKVNACFNTPNMEHCLILLKSLFPGE